MQKISLIWLLLAVCLSLQAQSIFRGVDFTNHHFSALDSALLSRNSVMYSGRNIYGMETDNKETVYSKWYNNKEKFYPVMCEAWKYCLNKLPYQLNMYKDGITLYQMMLEDVKDDSISRLKYANELLKLYDLRIQNLDSINRYVKRESDKSSKGNMMIYKSWAYEAYVLGEVPNPSRERVAIMYPMFKEAIGVIRGTFDEGEENGGDVTIDGLMRYFTYAAYNYFYIWNDAANDSLNMKKIRDAAKVVLLDEYNFMKDFCDSQIQDIGRDYVDSLSMDGSDSLDVVQEKVVAPYKRLMTLCDDNMRAFNINVSVQTLAAAANLYDMELESHKDSLVWLARVMRDCESAMDFDPDNMYYSFYEDVERYYTAALEKARDNNNARTYRRSREGGNEFYMKARPLYNKIVAFSQGRLGMDNSTFNSGLLCIYYLNQAIRTDPGHATTYMKMRAWISKGIKAEAFYRNVTSGQTVTVNGVTFTVTF